MSQVIEKEYSNVNLKKDLDKFVPESGVGIVLSTLEKNLKPNVFEKLCLASATTISFINKFKIHETVINPYIDRNYERIALMLCLSHQWNNTNLFSDRKILARQFNEVYPERKLNKYQEVGEFVLNSSELLRQKMLKEIWPDFNGEFSWFKENKIDDNGVVIIPFSHRVAKGDPKNAHEMQERIYEELKIPENQRFYFGGFAVPSAGIFFLFEDYTPIDFRHEKEHVDYRGLHFYTLGAAMNESITEIRAHRKEHGDNFNKYKMSYFEAVDLMFDIFEKYPKLDELLNARYEGQDDIESARNLSSEILNTLGIDGYLAIYFCNIRLNDLNINEVNKLYETTGFINIQRLRDMFDTNIFNQKDIKEILSYIDEEELIIIEDVGDLIEELNKFIIVKNKN